MIIDVTNPQAPVEKFLIPAPAGAAVANGRACAWDPAAGWPAGQVYLQRNVQGGAHLAMRYGTSRRQGTGDDVRAPQHSLDPQAMVGVQDRASPTRRAARTHVAPGAPAVAPGPVDAGPRLEQPVAPPVYIRTFGSAGRRNRAATGPVPHVAARCDLRARASKGRPAPGARRGPTTWSATGSSWRGASVTTA